MIDESIDTSFLHNEQLMLRARGVEKTFVLHTQGGEPIPALYGVDLDVSRGECVALVGPSGAGKSTLLRCLYGNYRVSAGSIRLRDEASEHGYLLLSGASPHDVMRVRRDVVGYVSQFLRVIPRVPTLDLVAEPLLARGVHADEARRRASDMLARLNIPSRLWQLAPATFSGGEQQRVNIARGLIAEHPVLLLDEPTASLDAPNRRIVAEVIGQARERGATIVGIFHDEATRESVATRRLELEPVTSLCAA
ncbi:phosphonate C-P lyase system protein PhnL [Burkholderia sp. WSM2230]|uniref:phosphonate C-P lyase system protein PhnL n=1 Tax=Burkholderia sp. WSM2230 TaxID=944435 RepID=UPI0004242079|nr:phosphonate C-P lyase system protein PhnL [Burkholderia sp. WSM2230]